MALKQPIKTRLGCKDNWIWKRKKKEENLRRRRENWRENPSWSWRRCWACWLLEAKKIIRKWWRRRTHLLLATVFHFFFKSSMLIAQVPNPIKYKSQQFQKDLKLWVPTAQQKDKILRKKQEGYSRLRRKSTTQSENRAMWFITRCS